MLQTIFTKKFIVFAILLAVIYLVLSVYLMNFTLVKLTIIGNYLIAYKLSLLIDLLGGMLTAMTGTGLLVLVLAALFTGLNLMLISKRISMLKSSGKLHWVVGGSSLLGIAGSGCAACGLPIIALLGLSGSVAFLPFGGSEISIISLILLSISFYLLLKSYKEQVSCKVDLK